MSVSLKSFVVEGKLAQSDVSLNGSGNTAYGVTGKLNADVQGFKAQLKVTDKTIQSLINNVSLQPEDAALEIKKDDDVVFGYNLQYQRASLKVQTKQTVADRDLLLSADWSQEFSNGVKLAAKHELDSKTTLTLGYDTNNSNINLKAKYVVDKSTIEGDVNVNNGNRWKASIVHALSKTDEVKAAIDGDKSGEPVLSYTRRQDGMELSLSAPVRSDICAAANFKITRTFDL